LPTPHLHRDRLELAEIGAAATRHTEPSSGQRVIQ
jgi:hypothetical protein